LKRNKDVVENKSSSANTLWATQTTLSKAFALGGCGICNAVRAAERKGIHSFLYEGMMFPFVRQQFLDGGGFCLRHFWIAKEIEDETWPTGGFGMAILCEGLTHLAGAGLSEVAALEPNARRTLLRRREAHMFLPGHDCMFCKDNRKKEQFLAEVLENLVDEEEFQKALGNSWAVYSARRTGPPDLEGSGEKERTVRAAQGADQRIGGRLARVHPQT
jgi:hypothetical protein